VGADSRLYRKTTDEAGGFCFSHSSNRASGTQGKTLEEARENLQEAIRLVFEASRELTGNGSTADR
jgi:predicted RNase H-like HicB family nuclease